MENPYVWDEDLRTKWLDVLRATEVNRYPDGKASELAASLTDAFSIPASLGLLLGNGSDELIQTVALAVGGSGRVMISPEPSFSMYRVIASITAQPISQHHETKNLISMQMRCFAPSCSTIPVAYSSPRPITRQETPAIRISLNGLQSLFRNCSGR